MVEAESIEDGATALHAKTGKTEVAVGIRDGPVSICEKNPVSNVLCGNRLYQL